MRGRMMQEEQVGKDAEGWMNTWEKKLWQGQIKQQWKLGWDRGKWNGHWL